MNGYDFNIVFEKLEELREEMAGEDYPPTVEAMTLVSEQELDDIAELRRLSSEVAEPTFMLSTGT